MITNAIDVLIPLYNQERFVSKAIESVLGQTISEVRIIIYDDGSTDRSRVIAQEFANRDQRVVLLSENLNRGVIHARNRLLEKVTGEFIAWLDSDDWFAPSKLEVQRNFLQKNPAIGAVGCGVIFTDQDGKELRRESYSSDSDKQSIDPEICCASVMVRTELATQVDGFRGFFVQGGEDGDWLMRIADHGQMTNIPDHLYYYRGSSTSLSRTNISVIEELRASVPQPMANRKAWKLTSSVVIVKVSTLN